MLQAKNGGCSLPHVNATAGLSDNPPKLLLHVDEWRKCIKLCMSKFLRTFRHDLRRFSKNNMTYLMHRSAKVLDVCRVRNMLFNPIHIQASEQRQCLNVFDTCESRNSINFSFLLNLKSGCFGYKSNKPLTAIVGWFYDTVDCKHLAHLPFWMRMEKKEQSLCSENKLNSICFIVKSSE